MNDGMFCCIMIMVHRQQQQDTSASEVIRAIREPLHHSTIYIPSSTFKITILVIIGRKLAAKCIHDDTPQFGIWTVDNNDDC